MAEVVGLVASSISIGHLFGGIVVTSLKASELLKEIKGLPDELYERLQHLRTLALTLQYMTNESDEASKIVGLQGALLQCQQCHEELRMLLVESQKSIEQARGIRRVKALSRVLLKRDLVSRVERRLSNCMDHLLLAHQAYADHNARIGREKLHEAVIQSTSTIRHDINEYGQRIEQVAVLLRSKPQEPVKVPLRKTSDALLNTKKHLRWGVASVTGVIEIGTDESEVSGTLSSGGMIENQPAVSRRKKGLLAIEVRLRASSPLWLFNEISIFQYMIHGIWPRLNPRSWLPDALAIPRLAITGGKMLVYNSKTFGHHNMEADELLGSLLSQLCTESILVSMQSNSAQLPKAAAAWLNEGAQSLEPSSEVVSSKGLFEKLKNSKPDIKTRRIHIPNPDPWSIAALMMSAPPELIPAFREFLNDHLSARGSIISVTNLSPASSSSGPYVLEFHLPHFVLRTEIEPRTDLRRKPDGSAWRHSQNLSLGGSLTPHPEAQIKKAYLHESQTSLVIAGNTFNSWTACLLTDNYFQDDDDPNDETSLAFYELVDREYEVEVDALAIGRLCTDRMVWDPREYFILILKFRLERIIEEWSNIWFQLRRTVIEKLNEVDRLASRNAIRQRHSKNGILKSEEAVTWIEQLASILSTLIKGLSSLTVAGSKFKKSGIYGLNLDTLVEPAHAVLSEIVLMFGDLEDIQDELLRLQSQTLRIKCKLRMSGRRTSAIKWPAAFDAIDLCVITLSTISLILFWKQFVNFNSSTRISVVLVTLATL